MKKNNDNNNENWKQDFPYKRQDSTFIGRREFAKMLALVSGGLSIGSGFVALRAHLSPKKKVVGEHFVCNKNDIPVGGTKSFVIEGSDIPYILIHLENGNFRAYEQKCTHLSCSIYYKPGSGEIICPCHNGSFEAETGVVLAGPPPRPLPKLEVVIKENKLFVKAENKNNAV
ncbi:MAG: Rieske (2Fe-2S) protein [Ignavibacteria bacterium]